MVVGGDQVTVLSEPSWVSVWLDWEGKGCVQPGQLVIDPNWVERRFEYLSEE